MDKKGKRKQNRDEKQNDRKRQKLEESKDDEVMVVVW